MSDFNTWDEVRHYLCEDFTRVGVDSWTFSKSYMLCDNTYDGYSCCEEMYTSIEDCMENLMHLAGGDVTKVEIV